MSTGGLRYQYARLNFAEKLIVINVAVFILNALLPFLLGFGKNAISQWFELPVDLMAFLSQPWSIVTYSFFHADFFHLFWNMLLLYFSARIFLNLFSARKLINVYFLGVILGGLLFVLSYNVFPVFLGSNSAIIGASAGVTAVLIFICAYIPNQEVRVIFFNVKLWYIGAFFVLVDLISIPASNSGGHLAHLGGALLGYVYARQLIKGKDIGEGFARILDGLGAMFKPREKKAPMKTVYRKRNKPSDSNIDYDKESRQRKIDGILDKISKSGYESLSKAEKDFLFKAGKED
ncbi:rhomboid family intramembrane serine protease [Muriicola marianensis]|uniref:Rhomboid family intramembrane serine protease n=1 Tax=Muriicola marianensis TaxID=1324801 RepID=A0ABQ1R7R6_9FLAO|nr:rhomboid family intramembrane serine protease [Muriicola marianensis]GGD57651.1 rhomboid family intramembrane serine protease [Muriicola marianensis]